MATRRMNGAIIDHGAQFLTAREPFFKAKIDSMLACRAATVWHRNNYGVMRFRGVPGMANIGQFMGASLVVFKQETVVRINWKSGHWQVVCDSGNTFQSASLLSTMPTPQLLTLIKSSNLELSSEQLKELEEIHYEPTIAMLAVLKKASTMQAPGILKFDSHPILETITDNHVKGTSPLPALTIHSNHSFARDNLESLKESVAMSMLQAAQVFIQFEVQEWALHRWRYAQCTRRHKNNFFRLDPYPLWLAGDAFGNMRLEHAAWSGVEAARSILSS